MRVTYDAFKDQTKFIYETTDDSIGGISPGGVSAELTCTGHVNQCRPTVITLSPWTVYDSDPSSKTYRAEPHNSADPLEILIDSTVRYRLDPIDYFNVVQFHTVHYERSYEAIPVRDFKRMSRARSIAYRWGSDERHLSSASITGLGLIARHISPEPKSSSVLIICGLIALIVLVAIGVRLALRSRQRRAIL